MAPDFSQVRNEAAAKELVAQGKLVAIHLFPAEFGGADERVNITYVTPEAAAARELILGTITRMIGEGLIDQLTVEPNYKGDSFVPSSLSMKAWHSEQEGRFEPKIEVW